MSRQRAAPGFGGAHFRRILVLLVVVGRDPVIGDVDVDHLPLLQLFGRQVERLARNQYVR